MQVKPERVFRNRFKERQCPKCKQIITPIANGSNPMHGFRLDCPVCRAYIGWGGKVYADHIETAVG